MPHILSASHSAPPMISQDRLRECAIDFFQSRPSDVTPEAIHAVFAHSQIDQRTLLMPLAWYFATHRPSELNQLFIQKARAFLVEACVKASQAAAIEHTAITHVIFATTTGFSTPSLDGHLIEALSLSRNVTRLPIWGLGCGAGASGLARAYDHCLAHPDAVVLLAAFEACSLHFHPEEDSKRNLVMLSLFSDCAAAVIVAGDRVTRSPRGTLEILATRSDLAPDSAHIAGWEVTDAGLRLNLSPELPALTRRTLGPALDGFLRQQGWSREQIAFYLFHPGGAKILETIGAALGLSPQVLSLSAGVLRDFGNTSSTSVLLVLERWLAQSLPPSASLGILGAFGPGYSTELLLVKS